MPWLVKVEAYDPALPGLVQRYYSDVGVTSGGADTPAHTYWVRRIHVPPSTMRAAFGGERAGGQSEAGFGTVSLANQDGALDTLAALAWDGHAIEVRYTAVERPVIADFAVLIVAAIQHVAVGDDVVFTLTERRSIAEKPWQVSRYAGTGAAEGGADWANVRKPRALGICWQVEPDEIDEANLVLAYGDSSSGGVLQVRDQGVPLRRGGNLADYAGLIAAAFNVNDFVTCNALAMLRLRQPAARPLIADVVGWTNPTALVTNFAFATDLSGWTAGAGWAWGTARANKTAGTGSDLSQAITTEAGAWYVIRVTSSRTSGSGVLALKAAGVTLVPDLSTDSVRGAVFQATATSTTIAVSADASWAGWVDDFVSFQIYARAGEMMREILLADTPLLIGDIETADITALHTANSAALGFYTRAGDERLVTDVLDRIAETVGALWGFDPVTGKFRVRRLDAPSGSPDHTIVERQVIRIAPREVAHRLREQTVEAARRWRPLRAEEIAGAVTEGTRQALITEAYPVTSTHTATGTEVKLYRDEKLESLFAYPAAAQTEADRRAALYGPARLCFEVEVEDIPTLDVAQTVRLEHSRYGIAGGRNFRVLRTSREGLNRRLTMTLWG
jgi:hypothetical protein